MVKLRHMFLHPDGFFHKGIVLVLMCLLGFGSYYCYDNPGPLQEQLEDELGMSTFQYGNLYSFYSWPNVILPLVGGYLIDTVFGLRLGAVIFSGFILLGQVVFSLGTLTNIYVVMILGRFVFGIGGESLAVAQNTYAAEWFSGKSLNMVFGFLLSTSRLGSSANFWTIGLLYEALKSNFNETYKSLGWTFIIASSTCLMSLIGAIILGFLDKRAQILLKRNQVKQDKVRPKDILTFPVTFWLLCLICVTYYVAIFPFVSFGKKFLIEKFNFDDDTANTLIGLPYLISAFASPILGFFIDIFGRNIYFVLSAVVLTFFSHALFAFSSLHAAVGISVMGLAYSILASSLWPMCTLLIPDNQLGTAFGAIQAIQNLGLALIQMAVGEIVDNFGYFWAEIFYLVCLMVAFISTLFMWRIDFKTNRNFLNMSPSERELKQQEKL